MSLYERNCKPGTGGMRVGTYKGLRLIVDVNLMNASLILRGKRDYSIDLGESDIGNITRMDNRISNIGGEVAEQELRLKDIKKQVENVTQIINKPFEREEELIKKRKEVDEINMELGINQKEEIDEPPEETVTQQEQNKAQEPEPEM